MNTDYRPEQIEVQAQADWSKHNRFAVDEKPNSPKYYALAMFPYPSGKLHIGHARVYTITDVLARFERMRGKQVLHPIGWDAFGLPAENAAIEQGVHPATWTYSNIDHMRKQLKRLGFSYDWRREFATCDPDYYKWEQWLFTELFKRGLAYRKESWVNWDPVDQTVLANEQVENGRGWRSGALVERKKLAQWNIRITDYAEELLSELHKLNWPSNIIAMQSNWIGKSVGAHISFALQGCSDRIDVFTTRPDTIMGASFIAVAANHPLVEPLCQDNPQLTQFVEKCRIVHEPDNEPPKEGMPTSLVALHPLTGQTLPVWVANFVLMEYGTGAIMSVPAHDQRDWEFATAYQLPIKQVIAPLDETTACDISKQAFTERGTCVQSGPYTGLNFEQASKAIVKDLEAKGQGAFHTNWRLRDWGVSRQRYWGAPIPIIHCPHCKEVPVPASDLPVELPKDVVFDGRGSPLANHPSFVNVSCPNCRAPAKRETDTFDTFIESSWYQSRFASYDCATQMLDDRARFWSPVNQYVGGIEHAILHLLYARFFHKVMRDIIKDDQGEPLLNSNEPFSSLLAQGMVLAPLYQRHEDGRTYYANEQELRLSQDESGSFGIHKETQKRYAYCGMGKMSKSKRNGIDPERVVAQYGADTLRLFLLFAAPPEQNLEWSERGVVGMHRFLHRVWALCSRFMQPATLQLSSPLVVDDLAPEQRQLWRKANQTLNKVHDDLARRHAFNTAIAAIMELANNLQKLDLGVEEDTPQANTVAYAIGRKVCEYLLCMLAPFTPHICHALWQAMGHSDDLLDHPFPTAEVESLSEDSITIVIQINGKLRAKIETPPDCSQEELQAQALSHPPISALLAGRDLHRVIIVPRKLVNLVVKG